MNQQLQNVKFNNDGEVTHNILILSLEECKALKEVLYNQYISSEKAVAYATLTKIMKFIKENE